MQAFIPSRALFYAQNRCGCEGVTAYECRAAAESKTSRRANSLAKCQYFRAEIPDESSFLAVDEPMPRQPRRVLDLILAESSLSLLYAAEVRDFTGRLGAYLSENGLCGDPEAARAETVKFYEGKRGIIKKLNSAAYLDLIKNLAAERSPAAASAYLSHIGIPGLLFHEPDISGRSYLMFNPRRDAVIKEIIRTAVPASGSVS
jgi:hypothetical protein